MQTTLLAVAIAIILALVAALVGPLLVDWGTYRTLLESEASHLIGLNVHVKGEIDARLLPSPRLTLHDVEIGAPGGDNVRARELNIELALGPLMRGQWHADDLYLASPRFTLTLEKTGHIRAPDLSLKIDPDALSVDRLHFDGGRVTLRDAVNGSSVTLEHVAFDGRAGSLLGPFDGEGSATIGKDYYGVRLSTGRYSATNGISLRVSVQPGEHPVSLHAAGKLTLADGKPHFDGSLRLQRPVGLAHAAGQLSQPWHVDGHVAASADSALMKDFQFRYGPQEHAIKLSGVVEFVFGRKPHLKAELTGNEIDLDQALSGQSDGRATPGAALRQLAGLAAKAFRPAVPIQIGLGIEQVTLAGGVLQNLRGDIAADAGGWNLNALEFLAPGYTDAKLSGQLTVDDEGVSFSGPAVVDATDPKALAAWLEGRPAPQHDELHPLHLEGKVTLGSKRIAVDDLTAGFARKTVNGHFDYYFAAPGHPSKFVAVLKAAELDLDAALGFGEAVLAGSGFAQPHDMAITADIGHATIAGIEGHGISAHVNVEADRWRIDRLTVSDLDGASFSAKGGLQLAGPSPQGNIAVDFTAPDMAPMMALLQRFAPKTAEALEARAPAMAPAELHAQLAVGGKLPAGQAKLNVNGHFGQAQVALTGEGHIDAKPFGLGDVSVETKLSAADGKALVNLLGLENVIAVGDGAGELTLKAKGPARGTLKVTGRLTAAGFAASADGSAQLFGGPLAATLHTRITRADAAPVRGIGAPPAPLPVRFSGRMALTAKKVTLSDVKAHIGGTTLHGRLAMTLGAQHHVAGAVEADSVAGPGLIAAAIGMPVAQARAGAAWGWSEDPFGTGAFGNFDGQLAVKLRQVELLPHLTAREFSATLKLKPNAFTLDDMDGALAGGKLTGSLSFKSGDDGVTAHGKIALAGIDAASLLRAPARPPVTGAFGLAFDVQGTGLSPVALIGSLHGAGTITLADAEFAGLDPRAFDAVTHAVDQGLPVEAARITNVVRKALDSGQLAVRTLKGPIAVNAGQVRLREVSADSADAALALSGNLDLITGVLDGHLVLSGTSQAGGVRPDIYMALKGPLSAPVRSIDVSALTGWLTLRAIANQAKRVQQLEQEQRKRAKAERKREEAARKRAEAARKRREQEEARKRAAAERAREEAARRKNEAAQQPSVPSPPPSQPAVHPNEPPMTAQQKRGKPAPAGPLQLVPVARGNRAPALPAPVEIAPLPAPAAPGSNPPPEASVGPQH